MNSRFRPVWLVLDPYTGTRALIGMLVAASRGVEFVSAPEPASRLRPNQQNIVDLATAELKGTESFEDFPMGLGPQVVLGEPAEVPAAVESPARWVAEQILRHDEAA